MTANDVFGFVGTILENRYRVEQPVGEGGFGVVYRAFNVNFDDAVALKCLKIPAHFTEEARTSFLQRFREEGRLLRKLGDKNLGVVRVSDFGVVAHQGTSVPYLALEWLDGATLDHSLANRLKAGLGPFSEREALALLMPVLRALDAAHSGSIGQVVAHRDVKPENLFVCADGALKVLDFGIAKVMQEGEQMTQQQSRTSSNFHAFSPGYGAPEQFHASKYGESGPWTDVHAMGLILTELLTGKRPLDGREFVELYSSSIDPDRPTPRRRGATAVSDGLEQICARALSLEPRQRYASAGAMLADLEALLASKPVVAAPPAEPPPTSRTSLDSIGTFVPSSKPPISKPPISKPPISKPPISTPAASVSPASPLASKPPVAPVSVEPAPVRTSLASISTQLPDIQPAATTPEPTGPSSSRRGSKKKAASRSAEADAGDAEEAKAPPSGSGRMPVLVGLGGVAALALGGLAFSRSGQDKGEAAGTPTDSAAVVTTASERVAASAAGAAPRAPAVGSAKKAEPEPLNRWVRVTPPTDRTITLGLSAQAGSSEVGFRPDRKVTAPDKPYDLQQHEVTWQEFDAWLARPGSPTLVRPAGVPASETERARLPAVGASWEIASDYCKSIGGRLPSEEEWEFAARGPDLNLHPWGKAPLDAAALRTLNSYRGPRAPLVAVEPTSGLDCTPASSPEMRICGLVSNVREWSADTYRMDAASTPEKEAWTTAGGMTWRAIRGLPLDDKAPARLPASSAAYRGTVCASGPCPKGTDDRLRFVGFRCSREAR